MKYMCNYICNMYVILKRSIDRMFADGDRGLAFYIFYVVLRCAEYSFMSKISLAILSLVPGSGLFAQQIRKGSPQRGF